MAPDSLNDVRRLMADRGLWAKSSGQLLIDHLVDVCRQAASFLTAYKPIWPIEDGANLERISAYASLLHDFGKVHPGFQSALRSGPRFDNRHEILSLAFLEWLEIPSTEYGWIAAAVATHHRDWFNLRNRFADPDSMYTDLGRLCHGVALETSSVLYRIVSHAPEIFSTAKWPSVDTYRVRPGGPLDYGSAILKALDAVHRIVNLINTGAALRPGLREERDWRPTLAAIHTRGWLLSADHLASLGPRDIRTAIRSRAEVRAFYPEFQWRGHQTEVGEYQGSALLVAPTGSGKTEAALLWAGRQAEGNACGRLLILLPYQASLNAMQKRLIGRFHPELAKNPEEWNNFVGLLHGRATRYLYEVFLEQDHAPGEAAAMAKRSNDLARLFAAPMAVSTIFSVVRLLFATRGPERLLVSFTGARIVVDEIHAYDTQIAALALAAIRFLNQHLGAKILFMSATVPAHLDHILREAIGVERVPKELLSGDKPRHRLTLSAFDSQSEDAIEAILDASEHGSVLVVVNQVKRAISLWSRLTGKAAKTPRLLHSRFHVEDRSAIESHLSPEPGMILVATQAVEVSLDLDFDRCYTELAPIESIVQRFGRCNRNGYQIAPAPVSVFLRFPAARGEILPYDANHLDHVRQALEGFCGTGSRDLANADIQALLDSSYTDEDKELFRRQTSAKIDSIERLFLNDWMPLGIKPLDEQKKLEEQWDQLFEGREVLPVQFVETALASNSWLDTARYLVPISEFQFNRLRKSSEVEWNTELACWVIRKPYGEAGLDLG